jgi:hypothetical protein
MAIARLSTGEVYGEYDDINELVSPVQVGRFEVNEDTKRKVRNMQTPLKGGDAEFILRSLGADVDEQMRSNGFEYAVRRVGCYVPPKERGGECSFSLVMEGSQDVKVDELRESDLSAYVTPHHAMVNDWHCVFSGTIVKGIQMEGDRQAVVYVTPGEWIRLAPSVLNWPIFAFGAPVIAVSHYDRELNERGWFDMELRPDHPILETMKF